MLGGVAGVASETQVAEALLAAADADLINCSFSGPTLNDAAPVAIERALAQLRPETVVVACAGNLATDRPQWPAASKRVIAVGAVGRDCEPDDWKRASFSDYGPVGGLRGPGRRDQEHVPALVRPGSGPIRSGSTASRAGVGPRCRARR